MRVLILRDPLDDVRRSFGPKRARWMSAAIVVGERMPLRHRRKSGWNGHDVHGLLSARIR